MRPFSEITADEREEVNYTQDEVYTIQSTSHHSECEFESKTKMR